MTNLLSLLAFTVLAAAVSCGGSMTVQEYAAACGDMYASFANTTNEENAVRGNNEWPLGMKRLNPPDELAHFHQLLVNPTWVPVEIQPEEFLREIIREMEQAVGMEVYSEDKTFEDMVAILRSEAERKWGDEASSELTTRTAPWAEGLLEQRKRMEEYGNSLIEAIEDLTPETRELLVIEGCIPP